jgi:methylated-DNA-protein-cysteine methyltransferase related protein
MTSLDELWGIVKSIPRGKVSTYGAVGAALKNPASGFMVGRWMAQCSEGVPWWRVVAKAGSFPIEKLDPYLELDQRRLLQKEGVGFVDDLVDMERHFWDPEIG